MSADPSPTPPESSRPEGRPRDPRASRRRIALAFALLLLTVGGVVIGTVLTTPVTASYSLRVTVESEPGYPPAEVFLGPHPLGTTPVTVEFSADDPRLPPVEPLGRTISGKILLAHLGLDAEDLGTPTEVVLPAGLPALPTPPLAGHIILAGQPRPGLEASYCNSVVRNPDGTLDHVYPVVVSDHVHETHVGFVLRARRSAEPSLALRLDRGESDERRLPWWRKHIDIRTELRVRVGEAYDLDAIHSRHGLDRWSPSPSALPPGPPAPAGN